MQTRYQSDCQTNMQSKTKILRVSMEEDLEFRNGKVLDKKMRASEIAKIRWQNNTLIDEIEKDLISSEFNEEAEI
ncbi:hypothetical protein JW868_02280 [Candidatus Woesearchaeota archaeon]|nr:hypothetical protein [Candidatus Woesearchaeota archaeon]